MSNNQKLQKELDDILWNIKQEDKRVEEIRLQLCEATQLGALNEKRKFGKDKCICGHIRDIHGKSYSINYTDGACRNCKCRNFSMK